MTTLYETAVFGDALDAGLTQAAGRFEGLLLGMAVGDALGLPYNGWPRWHVADALEEHAGPPWNGIWGWCSDDTEYAWMTALALLANAETASAFADALAWRLRFWLLMWPVGAEGATVRAAIRLLRGGPPARSGVGSAGNGPLTRAALIGAFFAQEPERMREMVQASTRLTHASGRVDDGAWTVATAAACAMRHRDRFACARAFFDTTLAGGISKELSEALHLVRREMSRNTKVNDLVRQLGLKAGAGGQVDRTVAAVIAVWLCHFGDYRATVECSVSLGGIVNTCAALAGGLAGITCGRLDIPDEWLAGIVEWPASIAWMRRVAAQLENRCHGVDVRPPRLFWPALLPRNLLFACVRLLYRCRRPAPGKGMP